MTHQKPSIHCYFNIDSIFQEDEGSQKLVKQRQDNIQIKVIKKKEASKYTGQLQKKANKLIREPKIDIDQYQDSEKLRKLIKIQQNVSSNQHNLMTEQYLEKGPKKVEKQKKKPGRPKKVKAPEPIVVVPDHIKLDAKQQRNKTDLLQDDQPDSLQKQQNKPMPMSAEQKERQNNEEKQKPSRNQHGVKESLAIEILDIISQNSGGISITEALKHVQQRNTKKIITAQDSRRAYESLQVLQAMGYIKCIDMGANIKRIYKRKFVINLKSCKKEQRQLIQASMLQYRIQRKKVILKQLQSVSLPTNKKIINSDKQQKSMQKPNASGAKKAKPKIKNKSKPKSKPKAKKSKLPIIQQQNVVQQQGDEIGHHLEQQNHVNRDKSNENSFLKEIDFQLNLQREAGYLIQQSICDKGFLNY